MLKNVVKNIRGVSYQYRKNRHTRYFIVFYKNKTKRIKKRKFFNLKKYGAKKALEKAINYRKKLEQEHGEPRFNKSQIFENEIEIKEDHVVLTIIHSTKYYKKEVKADLKHLDKLQDNYWHYNYQNNSVATVEDRKRIYISDVLFPEHNGVINHKNRDLFDFREENIILEDSLQYVKARKYPQTEEQPPGIHYSIKSNNGIEYWCASYQKNDLELKKHFPIKKLGYTNALEQAKEQRKEWEEEYGK